MQPYFHILFLNHSQKSIKPSESSFRNLGTTRKKSINCMKLAHQDQNVGEKIRNIMFSKKNNLLTSIIEYALPAILPRLKNEILPNYSPKPSGERQSKKETKNTRKWSFAIKCRMQLGI